MEQTETEQPLDVEPIESQLVQAFSDSGSSPPPPLPPSGLLDRGVDAPPALPLPPPITVNSADCPDDVEAATGTLFECSLSGSRGVTGTAMVTLENDDGTEYDYEGKVEGETGSRESSGSVSTSGGAP